MEKPNRVAMHERAEPSQTQRSEQRRERGTFVVSWECLEVSGVMASDVDPDDDEDVAVDARELEARTVGADPIDELHRKIGDGQDLGLGTRCCRILRS